jgi:sirohydrochlorin cobaltochelatase
LSWLISLNPPIVLPVYILIFHGSSDARSRSASEALTSRFRDRVSINRSAISDPSGSGLSLEQGAVSSRPMVDRPMVDRPMVELGDRDQAVVYAAYLECHPLPLHQQIAQIAQELQATHPLTKLSLRLLPVFLLPGVHLREDVPAEITQVQQLLGDSVTLDVTAHLGSHLGLRQVLSDRMSRCSMEAWILIAHGSRRPNANQPITALADDLDIAIAYWSTSPTLESRLQDCVRSGYKTIGILPFFLFHGGITDAIAQSITQLSQQYPTLKITFAKPLDVSPGLVDLLIDLAAN